MAARADESEHDLQRPVSLRISNPRGPIVVMRNKGPVVPSSEKSSSREKETDLGSPQLTQYSKVLDWRSLAKVMIWPKEDERTLCAPP